MKKITKEDWINKKKMELIGELLLMRIGQLLIFAAVFVISAIIWYRTETDVLYFVGYWFIAGMWIALLFASSVGTAIKRYKRTSVRAIHRRANILFEVVEEVEKNEEENKEA